MDPDTILSPDGVLKERYISHTLFPSEGQRVQTLRDLELTHKLRRQFGGFKRVVSESQTKDMLDRAVGKLSISVHHKDCAIFLKS